MSEPLNNINNFITEIIDNDLKNQIYDNNVNTRFPPEPNGYLHIGHAKSIFLNFGIADKYNGNCNLRFDDTNPIKESVTYINSITEDVEWLIGKDNLGTVLYASDYFDKMYIYAIKLIEKGLAYVDDQTIDEIKNNRGDYKISGVDSPYRGRSIDENLTLFNNMKDGLYKDGEKVLRAKIDMNASNINLRDPIMYRILHASHPRTKNKWCIYPMYDWAHGIEDSIEGITHSICTLEFEDHRPLYDWFLNSLDIHHSKQIEFAKLSMTYTIISKRNLLTLVNNKLVDGWDDPRMPTISGLRRRGYTPESIRNFVFSLGVAKREAISDFEHLEYYLREHLNKISYRVMAVMDPIKLTITNYPKDKIEFLKAENNPEDKSFGFRKLPFSNELYIERDDFMEVPPKKFFRLSIGNEVRLKHAYYIKCTDFIKNSNGDIVEIKCTYDPETRGGWSNDGRKVRGTIHWVSNSHAIDGEVRVYDRLFTKENPTSEGCDLLDAFNHDSIKVLKGVKFESSLSEIIDDKKFQFLRKGYFVLDKYSDKDNLIFNQSVALRSNWKK